MFKRISYGLGLVLLVVVALGGIVVKSRLNLPFLKLIPQPSPVPSPVSASQVMAYSDQPQLYISGTAKGYSAGGMIALASTDEPAIQIGGYNLTGSAEIELYQSNDDALLDYLAHDKDNKQTRTAPDPSKIHFVTTVKQDINNSNGGSTKVTLPLGETGVWYIKAKVGESSVDAFIVRSNMGALVKEGDGQFIFWAQDFKSKRSFNQGVVIVYSLLNGRHELERVTFDGDGVAKAKLTAEADLAVVAFNDDRAIVPLNLRYLNGSYSYQYFRDKTKQSRYFIFTDRPLYKPGDTVYFKAIVRDDEDARYTLPTANVTAKIYSGYYYSGSNLQPEFEKTYPVSADGTISGEFKLAAAAKVGYYTLDLSTGNPPVNYYYYDNYSSSQTNFDVQFFRKPDFSLDVSTPKTELIAGDKAAFKISGSYFSGQPLASQEVKYVVYAADFYDYQYLSDRQYYLNNFNDYYRYGLYSGNKVAEGTTTLDKHGEAVVNLDTKLDFAKGKSQIYSIETTINDGSIDPAFARRNVLVYAGEYNIFRQDSYSGSKINVPLTIPIALVGYYDQNNLNNLNLKAKIHREQWVQHQDPNQKYPTSVKEEEDLIDLTARTDSQGRALLTFTPTKIGSYTLTVSGQDKRGNTIAKQFYAYVTDQDYQYFSYSGQNNLTIAVDKQVYQPTDTAKISIYSAVPNRDVFLSLERGRNERYQIVHLAGTNTTVDMPLEASDIPNVYASVNSFDDSSLNGNATNVSISTASKKILVSVQPNSQTYGPGENSTLDIKTTDGSGNGVSSDVAVWLVDKAIFELSDNKLGDVFNTFWQERNDSTQSSHSLMGILTQQGGGGGGCFVAGTQVLMANGSQKNIENVTPGDYILTRTDLGSPVKARVVNTHSAKEAGYIIINGQIKVTANHIMWINDRWLEAGSIQVGDHLTDAHNLPVAVTSVEWLKDPVQVYNLEVEKYHTYFADGVWVHNQKGGGRSIFKDTAYWNPSIHTDSAGHAQVVVKLPDNLTTWTIGAVAATADTQVGQTTTEIKVNKAFVVRPILPNILRIGDEVVLSALLHNFTESDQTVNAQLQFDSGTVATAQQSDVVIKAGEMQQLYWPVKPDKVNDQARVQISAQSKTDAKVGDAVTLSIPVWEYGFDDRKAQTGIGDKTYDVTLNPAASLTKSRATLSLSPTLIGSLPVAMSYLVSYPFGCVEQTTSRFVPAVIAKTNSNIFATSLAGKDVKDIIQTGIDRLATLQLIDGGWTWWFSGRSDPFITAYVVEYVLQAQKLGAKVPPDMLTRAQGFFEQEVAYDSSNQQKPLTREEIIPRMYGLTLLGGSNKIKPVTDLDNLSPDLLAMAVMANYAQGNKDSQTNGLAKLVSQAKAQGDSLFWESGSKVNFGSQDASTAWAMRAILSAGGDRQVAAQGAIFLARSRQNDYWSNTYATAQVLRALVDFSKTGSELTPNYKYTVALDGNALAASSVTSAQQKITDLAVPIAKIATTGSHLTIAKEGDGQMYSTLVVNEFITAKNTPAVDHGLKVSREYHNAKTGYSLGVGDTVNVVITVSGLAADEYYGVIKDELPAGLIPINESFKNQQYGPQNYSTTYEVTDREITQNGIILSLYRISAGSRTYSYKARVISQGTFNAPPTMVTLMYAPEIWGRSAGQQVKVDQESHLLPGEALQTALTAQGVNPRRMTWLIGGLIIIGGGVFLAKQKGWLTKLRDKLKSLRKKDIPPTPPTPTPPASFS